MRFLFTIFFWFLCLNIFGQSKHSDIWVSGGFGISKYFSGMLATGFEPKNSKAVFIGRYSLMGELSPPAEPGIKESELGVLYGYKIGEFRFSAGLSRVWGRYRGSYLYTDPDPLFGSGRYYTPINYSRIGVPLEIRYLVSLKYFGVGVTGFANYCGNRSFVGINASLYLGYMN